MSAYAGSIAGREPEKSETWFGPDPAPLSIRVIRFELYENPPEEVIRAVEKIVEVAGLECGGIEYVVDKQGQWYIYDINALSILRASFKEEYGIDGWGQLADFFIEEYHKVVDRLLALS